MMQFCSEQTASIAGALSTRTYNTDVKVADATEEGDESRTSRGEICGNVQRRRCLFTTQEEIQPLLSSSAAADVGSSGKLCACRNAVCSRPGACIRASCSDHFIWRCVNSEWVDFDPRVETLHM